MSNPECCIYFVYHRAENLEQKVEFFNGSDKSLAFNYYTMIF